MANFELSRAAAEDLLTAAVRAPSSHNTQPWRFRLRGDGIELRADRSRALPVNDPGDRELTISCGCALLNLRVAAAAAGLAARIEAFPVADDADLLARVTLSAPAAQQGPADDRQPLAALHEAVAARRTVRQRFADTPLDGPTLLALVAAAREEGAVLHLLERDEQRHAAAALVAEGDTAQWADPGWRRELADWMHPRRRGDGLALPGLAVPLAQAVVRSFDMGQGMGAKDRELADASPLLVVLTTAGDAAPDWLVAGQALQRALLAGVGKGLQASYLNQPVQVAALRPRLEALLGRPGHAQLLLRFGVPVAKVQAAPRRALAEVIEVR